MSKTPTANIATRSERWPFLEHRAATLRAATLHADTIDASNTPTTQLRPGLVVAKRAADDKFIDAADASVQANAAAAARSLEAPDGDWSDEDITVTVPELGLEVTVTLGTISGGVGDAVADLNADAAFAAHFVASADTQLLITARRDDVAINVIAPALASAYGAAGVDAEPTITEHGILFTPAVDSMLGIDGAAEDRNVTILTANATVRESDLTAAGLTNAALLWFRRNNIRLV